MGIGFSPQRLRAHKGARRLVYHSDDAMLHNFHVEIQEQAGAEIAEPEIAEDLGFVDRVDLVLGFDFDD